MNPHQTTRDFERELCHYTGARFAVAVNSCTAALLIAVAWWMNRCGDDTAWKAEAKQEGGAPRISIPKLTYVGVPMSIIHAGGRPIFRDEDWQGEYQLKPLPVWDSARRFTSGMYRPGTFQCVSFHWSKILGIEQGGAILHDDPDADVWLRRARFDGRSEGVAPKNDNFNQLGWHCYLSPEVAAHGLMRLSILPKHNADLPRDDYPDLSKAEVFK